MKNGFVLGDSPGKRVLQSDRSGPRHDQVIFGKDCVSLP